MPSVPRILMSTSPTSKVCSATRVKASLAFSAVTTSYPSSANHLASESRTLSSSSTISSLPWFILLPHFSRRAVGFHCHRGQLAVNWQHNLESSSLSHDGVQFDVPAVTLHNILADGQAQS